MAKVDEMVNLLSVGSLVSIRDESDEGVVVWKFQAVQLLVNCEKRNGERTYPWGRSGTDGPWVPQQ